MARWISAHFEPFPKKFDSFQEVQEIIFRHEALEGKNFT